MFCLVARAHLYDESMHFGQHDLQVPKIKDVDWDDHDVVHMIINKEHHLLEDHKVGDMWVEQEEYGTSNEFLHPVDWVSITVYKYVRDLESDETKDMLSNLQYIVNKDLQPVTSLID